MGFEDKDTVLTYAFVFLWRKQSIVVGFVNRDAV